MDAPVDVAPPLDVAPDVPAPWTPPVLGCADPIEAPPADEALAPYFAYVEQPGGNSAIRLGAIDGFIEPITLLDAPDAMFTYPAFSRSGGYLAAVRIDADGSALVVLDLRCGELLVLVPAGEYSGMTQPAWRGDDEIAFLSGASLGAGARTAFLASLATGEVSPLFTPDPELRVDDVVWADGSWFAATTPADIIQPPRFDDDIVRVWRLTADGPELETLRSPTSLSVLAANPEQTAAGLWLGNLDEVGAYTWLTPEPLPPDLPGGGYVDCAIAPDGWGQQYVCIPDEELDYLAVQGSTSPPLTAAAPHVLLRGAVISPIARNTFTLGIDGGAE